MKVEPYCYTCFPASANFSTVVGPALVGSFRSRFHLETTYEFRFYMHASEVVSGSVPGRGRLSGQVMRNKVIVIGPRGTATDATGDVRRRGNVILWKSTVMVEVGVPDLE